MKKSNELFEEVYDDLRGLNEMFKRMRGGIGEDVVNRLRGRIKEIEDRFKKKKVIYRRLK